MQNEIGLRVRFTAGLEFGRENCALEHVAAAIGNARVYAAKTFGGYTETLHNGGWISPKGELVSERGLTFEVIIPASKIPSIELFAEYLRRVLNQEQVLVTQETVIYSFHAGNKPAAAGVINGAGY